MDTMQKLRFDPSRMPPATSPSASSILPTVQRPKCPPEQAAKAAQLLLGCYRKGDAADPDTYVAAIAATLAQFPEHVVRKITNPVTGIPARIAFLPAVAEVRQACQGEIDMENAELRAAQDAEAKERAFIVQQTEFRLRRTAECHFWLRAKEIGDPKADIMLRGYANELPAALEMTLAEALTICPAANSRLTRKVEEYTPLVSPELADKLAARGDQG